MRIVLLYPPPWKIPVPGESLDPAFGPPPGMIAPMDPDLRTMPYGLRSLAAQAVRAGHEVRLLNLCAFVWTKIREILASEEAALFGISCLTANRRGALALASLIKELHPAAHVVLGGPHASVMPQRLLEVCPALDSIVVGEGEITFLEMIERLQRGDDVAGIAGTVARANADIVRGPIRARIGDLDSLADPSEYFSSRILITSRGCPGECTFCDSKTMWQRRLHFHSPEYVLKTLRNAVEKHGLQFVCIKDDTFTANRRRALEICRGIVKSKIKVVWSCDTRVDALDEEILKAMREAGCRMLSLGVESGSDTILKSIKKRTSKEKVLKATELAKKFGFQVRFYMMWGNRGETLETIRESMDLIKAAKPNQVLFTLLSIYPGTEEFKLLRDSGQINEDIFFNHPSLVFKFYLGKNDEFEAMRHEIDAFQNSYVWDYSLQECEAAASALPALHDAQLDCAAAHLKQGHFTAAEDYARKAMKLGHPQPGLALNIIACAAALQGQLNDAEGIFDEALRYYPHAIAMENKRRLALSKNSNAPLNLIPSAFFETFWPEAQPEKPGPILG